MYRPPLNKGVKSLRMRYRASEKLYSQILLKPQTF
nr:MAG TPA: hypothetical protein [Caudoviricetes sp.]